MPEPDEDVEIIDQPEIADDEAQDNPYPASYVLDEEAPEPEAEDADDSAAVPPADTPAPATEPVAAPPAAPAAAPPPAPEAPAAPVEAATTEPKFYRDIYQITPDGRSLYEPALESTTSPEALELRNAVGEPEYIKLLGDYQRAKSAFDEESEERDQVAANESLPKLRTAMDEQSERLRGMLGADFDAAQADAIGSTVRKAAADLIQNVTDARAQQYQAEGMPPKRAAIRAAAEIMAQPGIAEAAIGQAIVNDLDGFLTQFAAGIRGGQSVADAAARAGAAAAEKPATPAAPATPEKRSVPNPPQISGGSGRNGATPQASTGKVQLTAEELKVCRDLGIKPSDFAKTLQN